MNGPITRTDNPAACGWRWVCTYTEFPEGKYEHEIAWPRGTNSLFYSTRVSSNGNAGRWGPAIPISHPDYYVPDGAKVKDVDKLARSFIAIGGGDE